MSTQKNEQLQKELVAQLINSGAGFAGFADISDARLPDYEGYGTAISIGIPYASGVVENLDSDCDAYNRELQDTYDLMEVLLELCKQNLEKEGFSAITHFSKNLPGFRSTFSHKMAATKAGLGWIGKNALFVSHDFGCGVRLGTALTDAPFTTGEPVTGSQCGDCVKCVEACPYHALKGETWYPGIDRDNLLNAPLCAEKRGEFIEKLGYRHPCGLCIKACPVRKRERK